jgi:hypothetical protein
VPVPTTALVRSTLEPTYVWTGAAVSNWNVPGNWSDGDQTTASAAPGIHDHVTINSPDAAQVITGNGEAASLTINGLALLEGHFTVGSLTVGGLTGGIHEVSISNGATVVVTGDATESGTQAIYQVDGQVDGATFTVEGTFAASATDSLDVSNGGHVQLGG